MSRRIFISAVSKELQSYRKLVAESLRKRGYIPVDQEIFNLTDQEIVHLLKDKLAPCDAVVCLIGQRYGAEPSRPLDGFPRRSFTQLEYIFARAMTEPRPRHISLFLTTDQTPPDHPNDEPDELRELQRAYRAEVTRDRNWRAFHDAKELRAEIAELRFPWEQSTEHKPCNLPPSIGTLFKGRDEFLAELRAKLKEVGVRAAAITPRQAIHGLGGVGKTCLAVEFGWRHFDDYHALLYLYAENPSALLTNLAQLAGVLELPERELREDEKRADAVLRWLNEHRDWLLLIDNVDTDEAAAAVIARLEKLHGGHIIITSRLSRWPKLVEPMELDVLDKAPAVAFLLEAAVHRSPSSPRPGTPGRGVGGEGDADDAEQAGSIWDDVDGLALALTQAAGYIDKYRISFAAYRKRWQQSVATVAGWHDPRTMTYPRSLAVTWNTTVDRLTPPARTLLELLSFLAPEPIPRDLICGETSAKPLADAGIAEPEEALLELADVSLAKVGGETATLHRLVMEITYSRMPPSMRANRYPHLLTVVTTCEIPRENAVWDSMMDHTTSLTAKLIIHGSYADGLKVCRRAHDNWPRDPIVMYNLACIYSLLRRVDSALRCLRRAWELGYRDLRYLREDIDLAYVREDSRFLDLVRDFENGCW